MVSPTDYSSLPLLLSLYFIFFHFNIQNEKVMLANLPNQYMYMYKWQADKDLGRSVDSSCLYQEGLGHMLGHSRPLWCLLMCCRD